MLIRNSLMKVVPIIQKPWGPPSSKSQGYYRVIKYSFHHVIIPTLVRYIIVNYKFDLANAENRRYANTFNCNIYRFLKIEKQ